MRGRQASAPMQMDGQQQAVSGSDGCQKALITRMSEDLFNASGGAAVSKTLGSASPQVSLTVPCVPVLFMGSSR